MRLLSESNDWGGFSVGTLLWERGRAIAFAAGWPGAASPPDLSLGLPARLTKSFAIRASAWYRHGLLVAATAFPET